MIDEEKITYWITCIHNKNQDTLYFDEIYNYVFTMVYEEQTEPLKIAVKSSFERCIKSLQKEIVAHSEENFDTYFQGVCEDVQHTIELIEQLFHPILIVDPSFDIKNDLLQVFRKFVFEKAQDRMESFLVSFAHKIVVHPDKDTAPIYSLLMKIIYGTENWKIFVESLYEATDGLFLSFTAKLFGNERIKKSPIIYISAAMGLINRQQKTWELFPKNVRDELNSLAIYDLCDLFLDSIFSPENIPEIQKAFFEDFNNFEFLQQMLRDFFISTSSREKLVEIMFDYYRCKFPELIAPIKAKISSQISATIQMVKTLNTIFQKLNILSSTRISETPGFYEQLDEFKRYLISDPELYFEQSAARAIGKSIENIFNNQEKAPEELRFIKDIGRIISYSKNRLEFITTHNAFMIVRLCQCGGRQFRIEEKVLNTIDSFLPPDLSSQYDQLKSEFENSYKLWKKWETPKTPRVLSVFVLNKKSTSIGPSKQTKLQPTFTALQNEFIAFFKSQEPHKKLEWVYEDNQIILETSFKGCTFNISAPLYLCNLFIFVSQFKHVDLQTVMDNTGFSLKELEKLVQKLTLPKLPLAILSTKEITPQTEIIWNQDFSFKLKKITIVIPPTFSLKVAHPKHLQADLLKKRLHQYQIKIISIMKTRIRLSKDDLRSEIQRSISASFVFNEEEFEDALSSCMKKSLRFENGKYVYKDIK